MPQSKERADDCRAGNAGPPWWRNPLTAYVAPFALFMLLGTVEGWGPLSGYYPLLYGLKIVFVLALWFSFRKHYPVPTTAGFSLGILAGIVGAVVWIGLCRWNLESHLQGILPDWLYSPDRVGFDPFSAIDSPAAAWAFIAVRLCGLTIVVPLMEEVFWRGFLIRYLVSDDFQNVPIGRYTPLSFVVVTMLFVLAHPELLAAAVWCTGINLLLYRTKNLWGCIVAHATTNLLLGIYVLATKTWELW